MSSTSPVRPTGVDFHFDIMCPYAYQTSLWMRQVRDMTGVEVRWRFFSLEEINRQEGKKHPWERDWSYGWSMMRIGALLRRRSMADIDAWYDRYGSENADKCAWTFGPTHRAANGAPANVLLGNEDWLIQQNWVATSPQGCALHA